MWIPQTQQGNINLWLSQQKQQLELRVGQIINARVIEGTPRGQGGGKVTLQINGEQIAARSQTPLKDGEQIRALVASNQGEVILKVRPDLRQGPINTALTAQKIRLAIGQAGQITPLLSQLKVAQQQISQLPAKLQVPLQKLLSQIPQWDKLTQPEVLKNATLQSGMFLEALQASGLSGKEDIKLLLLEIKHQLNTIIQEQKQHQSSRQPQQDNQQNSKQQNPQDNKPVPQRTIADKPVIINSSSTTKPVSQPLNPQKPLLQSTIQSSQTSIVQKPPATATTNPLNSSVAMSRVHQAQISQSQQTQLPSSPPTPASATTTPTAVTTTTGQQAEAAKIDPLPFREMILQSVARVKEAPGQFKLDQWLTEFKGQIDSALNRIQIQQLARNDPNPTTAQTTTSVEIPIHSHDGGFDLLRLRWQEPEQQTHAQENDEKKGWEVEIAVDLPSLGPIYAKINLDQKMQLDLRLWLDNTRTHQLLIAALPQLEKRLEDTGLQITLLECLQGPPPQSANLPNDFTHQKPLVDTKA